MSKKDSTLTSSSIPNVLLYAYEIAMLTGGNRDILWGNCGDK